MTRELVTLLLREMRRFTEMRVYLDNCCFNRPYDDQSYMSISLETQAKLYIQDMIRNGQLEMESSYMLVYENEDFKATPRKDVYVWFRGF